MPKCLKKVRISVSTEVSVDVDLEDKVVLRCAVPSLVEKIRGLKVDSFCIEDLGEVAPEPFSYTGRNCPAIAAKRRLIGYQIVSNDGTYSIPNQLYSFMVLSEKAVKHWWEQEEKEPTGNWTTVPVYAGEIEDPVIITNLNSFYD